MLLKGIEFLYRHWDLLPEDQAIKLRGLLLGSATSTGVSIYWRLLLHWAPAVRKFFAHLAVFRLPRPCMWSLPIASHVALPELPPHLAVRFERRAVRLAELAQSYRDDCEAAAAADAAEAAADDESFHTAAGSGGSSRASSSSSSGSPRQPPKRTSLTGASAATFEVRRA